MKGRAHTEQLDDRYLVGSWAPFPVGVRFLLAEYGWAPDHGERVMGLYHLLPPFVEALQEGAPGTKWR